MADPTDAEMSRIMSRYVGDIDIPHGRNIPGFGFQSNVPVRSALADALKDDTGEADDFFINRFGIDFDQFIETLGNLPDAAIEGIRSLITEATRQPGTLTPDERDAAQATIPSAGMDAEQEMASLRDQVMNIKTDEGAAPGTPPFNAESPAEALIAGTVEPAETGAVTHTVRQGDTLSQIAVDNGVDLRELLRMNPQISNPDRIMPGMQIRIPAAPAPVRNPRRSAPAPVRNPRR